jgi:hypothetical protein
MHQRSYKLFKYPPNNRRICNITPPPTQSFPSRVDLSPYMPPPLDQLNIGACASNAASNILRYLQKKENIPEKQLSAWINGMKYPETLPNILFDITMKDLEQVDKYVPMLINVGYKPENIHVTWVLANYSVAVVRNRTRERVVPDDIMLQTHSGAAMTIHSLLNGKLPKTINGSFTVVLNNFEEVTYYDQTVPKYQKTDKFSPLPGAPLKTDQGEVLTTKVVKDFKYITLKKTKQSMPALAEMDKQIKQTLFDWVLENAPRLQIIQKSFTL